MKELVHNKIMIKRPQIKIKSNNKPGSFVGGGFLICGLVSPASQDFKWRPHENITKKNM